MSQEFILGIVRYCGGEVMFSEVLWCEVKLCKVRNFKRVL